MNITTNTRANFSTVQITFFLIQESSQKENLN